MLSNRGRPTPRVAPAPMAFSLEGVSREAVMDAHPWAYRVSGQEVRREGRVAERSAPGLIRDPRGFAYLEACGEMREARLAFDIGLAGPDGNLRWSASDARGPDFRIGRSGCFRSAVALPAGASASDARALRVRAHTGPPRDGEPPLPSGTGSVRLDRVNRLFGLGSDDAPGRNLLQWVGTAELKAEGDPLVLEVGSFIDPPFVH